MNESQLSRGRDNSNESLERIHTFSLKNSFSKMKQESSAKRKEATNNNDASGNKTYYVEESVKILENIILKADPILSELASKVKQFEKIHKMTAAERDQDILDKYGPEEY